MQNYNSIFNNAIYALSGRKHIEEVRLMRFDNGEVLLDGVGFQIKYDMPDISYLLCELDCPKDEPQACHIYMASDGKGLIVAGEQALDALKDNIYRKAETIAKKYDLQITEDPIGENNVFSETVPLESYKWELHAHVLNVARAEKEFLRIKRT